VADGSVVTFSCTGFAVDGSSLALTRTGTDGSSAAVTLSLGFPACDEDQPVNDSLTMWGLGLTACAAVWAVKSFVYKLVANQ
jgi:hypothetical protein